MLQVDFIKNSNRITHKTKNNKKILRIWSKAKVNGSWLKPQRSKKRSKMNHNLRKNPIKVRFQGSKRKNWKLTFCQSLMPPSKTLRRRLQLALLSWLTRSNRRFILKHRELQPSARSLQEQKEKVSPPKVEEAEEVEEDALVLPLKPPNWKMTTNNLNRPLFPNPEEAVAKNLNYLLLRSSKKRSHWSCQSLKKNLHQRKVVEKDDNQLQPNRFLSKKNWMKRCSQRLPEEERNSLVAQEEEAKPPSLPSAQEPPPLGEAEARK